MIKWYWKRMLILFMAAMMLASALMCPALAEDETDILSDASEETIDYENLVTDAYSDVFEYTDGAGNSGTYEFHIPQINLEGESIEEINTEIWTLLYDNNLLYVYDWVSSGESLIILGIDYDWTVNGSILSLVVEIEGLVDVGTGDYYIYNVDIIEREKSANSTILDYCGLSEDEYKELVRQALYSCSYDYYEQVYDQMDESTLKFTNDQLSNTISDDNVASALPFINNVGELCILGSIYDVAGPATSLRIINLEDFEVNANYPNLFGETESEFNDLTDMENQEMKELLAADISDSSENSEQIIIIGDEAAVTDTENELEQIIIIGEETGAEEEMDMEAETEPGSELGFEVQSGANTEAEYEDYAFIWEEFLLSASYTDYTVGWDDSSLEYAITDINADSVPELLIQSSTDAPFYNTWLFVLENEGIVLVYERYGYGSYRYSPGYNAILVSPETKPFSGTESTSFYILQGTELTYAFQVGQDNGQSFYSDANGTINISDEEREAYFADAVWLDWERIQSLEAVEGSAKTDLSQYLGTDLYSFIESVGGFYDVGATDGTTEYSNGAIIVSCGPDSNNINFVNINGECDYSIKGIEYGMSFEEATGLAYQSCSYISDDLSYYKLFVMDDGTTLSFHAEDENFVDGISLWS